MSRAIERHTASRPHLIAAVSEHINALFSPSDGAPPSPPDRTARKPMLITPEGNDVSLLPITITALRRCAAPARVQHSNRTALLAAFETGWADQQMATRNFPHNEKF